MGSIIYSTDHLPRAQGVTSSSFSSLLFLLAYHSQIYNIRNQLDDVVLKNQEEEEEDVYKGATSGLLFKIETHTG